MIVAPRAFAGLAITLIAGIGLFLALSSFGVADGDVGAATSVAGAPSDRSLADPTVTGTVSVAGLTMPAVRTPERLDVAAVDPAAVPALASTTPNRGTPEFRAALTLLSDGKHAEAFGLAAALPDDVERRTVQWAAIYRGNGSIDYASVIRFSADAPSFSDQPIFRTRLEQALTRANAAGADIIRILGGAMPNTVDGQIALARAYVEDGQTERAARIARTIWTTNFLARDQEDRVRAQLGNLLTVEDHWDRAVYLMMHDRATGAERLMSFFSPQQKSLVIARNATSRKAANAKKLLDSVDPSMQSHPVFLFSRAQRARQFELWQDAVDWLDKAGASVPEAAEWWYERRLLTRRLIADGNHALAYAAAAGFTDGPAGPMVEAQFHAGWIALSFLGDPEAALPHFETMREHATLPDSITQSLYWTGRTKRALGDRIGGNEAFMAASRYTTVFYGQLARAELGIGGSTLRDLPEAGATEAEFEANEVVRAARLLALNGERALALPLLRGYALQLADPGLALLAARLAQELGAHDLAIAIAETADRKGMPLDVFSFPKAGLPVTKLAEVDVAAVFAVAKQESHFRVDAVSSAGARGLMQLMPGTAKETAQKVGLEYSPSRLTSDGEYNALLGSTYLAAQLNRFDGSLVLAAAAYNAGAGNALKWIAAYGDPRDKTVDPVDWVELIPFQETRTYVRRVLGNYLVYRDRLGQDVPDMHTALRSIY